jgi:hypothetical protein
VIVEIDRVAGVVTKRAETPDEAERVRREAEVLGVARHPGVVELLGSDGDSLTLRLVEGGAGLTALSRRELLAVAAALATTLADLHDIGVVYGGRFEDHVLLDGDGRPVLCSFGHARSGEPPDDVAALGQLFTGLLSPVPPPLVRAMHRDPRRRLTARALAVAMAKPERADHSAGRIRLPATVFCPRNRRGLWAGVAAALVIAIATLMVTARHAKPRPVGCPAVDLGCHPVALVEGILITDAGHYRIGDPDDVVVVGRWSCVTSGLPALLRRSSGEVWVFDRWAAAGEDQPARLLTRVRGATSLSVAPGRSGCDQLLVTRRARAPVRVLPD